MKFLKCLFIFFSYANAVLISNVHGMYTETKLNSSLKLITYLSDKLFRTSKSSNVMVPKTKQQFWNVDDENTENIANWDGVIMEKQYSSSGEADTSFTVEQENQIPMKKNHDKKVND